MTLRPRSTLREGQLVIADQIRSNPARLIVSHMGSGKTGATLTALRDLLDAGTIKRVLVIAPKLVATSSWPDEIETWEHTAGLSYAVVSGTEEQRLTALKRKAQITIINRENLVWLAKVIQDPDRWPYDSVVIDESSMFKGGQERTAAAKVKKKVGDKWQICRKGEILDDAFWPEPDLAQSVIEMLADLFDVSDLEPEITGPIMGSVVRPGGNLTRFGVMTQVRRRIKRIYELTGTPSPNGVQDLWGQIYLLDQGQRLGRTRIAFERRWFKKNPYDFTLKPKEGAIDAIMKAVSDVMVTMPQVELVPPPVYIPVRVKLSAKVMREYHDLEQTLVSQIHDVEAVNSGVLANKLLQFANGAMFRSDSSVVKVHGEKMAALVELIEQAGDEPVLLFYSFQFDLAEIRAKFPHAVVLNEAEDAVKRWNKGEIKLLVAHPASCAHGLNLQYGGHIAIWFGLTWSLELYLQANARLPRPGQKNIVAIYQIIAEDTYDERVLEVLGDKEVDQNRIVDSVRLYFKAG